MICRGRSCSGRVVDESGNPIANASIRTIPVGTELQPFSWQGNTDEDGRFLWDSAPAKALSYAVTAVGYDPRSSVVLAPSREHEIRLTRSGELIVSGRVTDAKSKMPIDSFKVSALSDSRTAVKSVDGKAGEFALSLQVRSTGAVISGRTMSMPTFGILVEADGYLPDLSQQEDARQGSQYLEISLVRGNGLAGNVVLPNGGPAAYANVFLCSGTTTSASTSGGPVTLMSGPTMSGTIKSIRCSSIMTNSPFDAATETDASGRFSLKPAPQAHTIHAVHEKGFAAVAVKNLPVSGTIKLQSWGRIEGVLMIGRKPVGNQPLFLYSMDPMPRPSDLRVSFTAAADGEGRFVFAAVPPGEYRISPRTFAGSSGQSANATARSGETTSKSEGPAGPSSRGSSQPDRIRMSLPEFSPQAWH